MPTASCSLARYFENSPEDKGLLIKRWNFCTYTLSIFSIIVRILLLEEQLRKQSKDKLFRKGIIITYLLVGQSQHCARWRWSWISSAYVGRTQVHYLSGHIASLLGLILQRRFGMPFLRLVTVLYTQFSDWGRNNCCSERD